MSIGLFSTYISVPGNQRFIVEQLRLMQAYFSSKMKPFWHVLIQTSNVYSESWRLGSGLRAQGCGQEGVPQVPQALHLVRAGENSQQTHPILRLTGSKELCWCSCMFTCHAWLSAQYKTVAKWQPSPFSSDEMADRPELHVRLWGSSGWLLLLRCDQTSPSCDLFPPPVLSYKLQWGRKCCYGALWWLRLDNSWGNSLWPQDSHEKQYTRFKHTLTST